MRRHNPSAKPLLPLARSWWSAVLTIVLSLAAVLSATQAADRPNIVVILADDLGWSDLGCYGADLHETPHLDQLAASGLRFTQAYGMSVCSPSRAMLLTGKHAARLGITIWSEGSRQGPQNRRLRQGESLHDLPHAEKTLAESLQERGYLTAAIGKWHLGDADHFPETQGFDVNIGGMHWGAPTTFWWPYRGAGRFPEFRYVPHLEFGKPGEYLTDRLTDEALRVIDHAGGRPFFLYLAHYAPHTPIEAKPADIKHFESRLRPEFRHQNAVYAAMVKNLDENVGRVVEHLRQRQLLENTIVVFASDNGGFIGVDRRSGQRVPVTSNWPLRSGKGSLYEGGVRIPLLVSWPGHTKPETVTQQPVTLSDLHATLLTAAGDAATPTVDGLDLTGLLEDPPADLDREALFFHYPHYYETTTPASAIRAGDWKLIEYFEDGRRELYNLKSDPSEERDVAATETARATELYEQLAAWRRTVGARLPTRNEKWPQ